jgi:hypothetical protein
MLWKEVKTWAKNNGYDVLKDKEDNQYYWAKLDTDASGVAKSVSKLAFAIYNHMTDNKWLDHQKQYSENNKDDTQFSVSDYGN